MNDYINGIIRILVLTIKSVLILAIVVTPILVVWGLFIIIPTEQILKMLGVIAVGAFIIFFITFIGALKGLNLKQK